jgi:hypothetical protein
MESPRSTHRQRIKFPVHKAGTAVHLADTFPVNRTAAPPIRWSSSSPALSIRSSSSISNGHNTAPAPRPTPITNPADLCQALTVNPRAVQTSALSGSIPHYGKFQSIGLAATRSVHPNERRATWTFGTSLSSSTITFSIGSSFRKA